MNRTRAHESAPTATIVGVDIFITKSMMRAVEDNVSKIKDKVDIVDLVGSYVKLTKAGVNYKAPCPFHNEKTGSFFVSPERQIWHCFGCGLGGDIFGFIKQIEGVEFPEALRILAARAGIELSSFRPNPEYQNAKTRMYELCELASKFFGKQLHESPVGKQALAYLKDRGLIDASIGTFHLGFAPDTWSGLSNFLYSRGYTEKEIIDAGLAIKGERGVYDRFRSRIMFPIFDMNGQTVGFAGRIFGENKDESQAKYVNTPQTAIYDKGRLLYGLNFARMDLRKQNRCLVVEGNMDVIMSHQAGVRHAVASSGTALTDGHLRIIKRYTDNLDLCFDADSAGSMATDRGVALALSRAFNVNILTIDEPGIKDAADYVKAHGEAWAAYADRSKPFMDFYLSEARKQYDLATAVGKKLFSQKILPLVASMASRIEQAHWVSEIATVLKVKEDMVAGELAVTKPNAMPEIEVKTATVNVPVETRVLDIFEESILSLLVKKPSLREHINEEDLIHFSPEMRTLLATKTMPLDHTLVQVAALRAEEYWRDVEDTALEAELKNLLNHLKKRKIIAKLEGLEFDIKLAEKDGNRERLATLVSEFTSLSSKL